MRFGVEYTFLKPNAGWRRLELVADTMVRKGFKRAHVDAGAVEVPSPPHLTLDEAKRFFDRLGAAAGLNGLKTHYVRYRGNEEIHEGTGGGHVHVELPIDRKIKTKTLYHLVHFFGNRPWLNWVFNEFGDDINANFILTHCYDIRKYWQNAIDEATHLSTYLTREYETISGDLFYNGGIRLGNHNQTIEFRVFDAPKNWKQAEDHIKFALAVVNQAVKRAKRNQKYETPKNYLMLLVPVNGERFDFRREFSTTDAVEHEFKATVKSLGLSWSRYKPYLKNFKERLAHGKLV